MNICHKNSTSYSNTGLTFVYRPFYIALTFKSHNREWEWKIIFILLQTMSTYECAWQSFSLVMCLCCVANCEKWILKSANFRYHWYYFVRVHVVANDNQLTVMERNREIKGIATLYKQIKEKKEEELNHIVRWRNEIFYSINL